MIKEGGEWKTVDWAQRARLRRARPQGRHGEARRRRARHARVAARDARGDGAGRAPLARARLGQRRLPPAAERLPRRRAGRGHSVARHADRGARHAGSRVLVVGSFLRKDHPLAAQRLRQAARKGAQVSVLHSVADDSRIRARALVRRGAVADAACALAEIVVAAAKGAGKPVPAALAGIEPAAAAQVIAASLARRASARRSCSATTPSSTRKPRSSSRWRRRSPRSSARSSAASPKPRTASAATWPARCRARRRGLNARAMFADPRQAYVVLGAEPEFDCANPVAARAALEKAEFVVVMSPFRHGMHYADVLLPISPFTETAGTFVNCEGRAAAVQRRREAAGRDPSRRGRCCACWARCSDVPGFDFETIDDVRASLPTSTDIAAMLGNGTEVAIAKPATPCHGARARRRRADPFRRPARRGARRRCSRPPTRSRRGRG